MPKPPDGFCRGRHPDARQCVRVIGRQISHFYVIRTLGTGGMGVVYEAQDTRLPRSVAIKVLKEELARDGDAIMRFKREARLASSLNHPNICTILDVNDDESQSFIAMELLEGASLKAQLLQGPVSLDEMVEITSQVADALGAAHEQGIIHRDITPGNIFLSANGPVKLLDFGLAKHFPASGADGLTEDLTSVGVVHGTIHYMAPEQLSRTQGSITDAISMRSAWCSIKWRPAPVRSTSSREARSWRQSNSSLTSRCGSSRRTIHRNWHESSTRSWRRISGPVSIRRHVTCGTGRAPKSDPVHGPEPRGPRRRNVNRGSAVRHRRPSRREGGRSEGRACGRDREPLEPTRTGESGAANVDPSTRRLCCARSVGF